MNMIYVAHAKIINYREELYNPIKNCSKDYKFILPHELSAETTESSKPIIKKCKFMIADVSKRATGLGIEMGWAEAFNIPIISIHKSNTKVSSSVKLISTLIIEYKDNDDLIEKLAPILENFDKITKN